MTSPVISRTAASLRHKLARLERALAGIDDAAASTRPAPGEWCVKEVLSHLCGDDRQSFLRTFERFLEEEAPLIGVVARLPFYSPAREAMSVGALADAVHAQYEAMAAFLDGLSDEQLARTARVPITADVLGERITLAQWASVAADFHVAQHVEQIRATREAVETAVVPPLPAVEQDPLRRVLGEKAPASAYDEALRQNPFAGRF